MSDWTEKINALVDDQLSAEEKAEVTRLVAEDPAAQAEYQWALYVKDTLAAKCAPVADDDSWREAVARLDAIDRTKRTETFVGRYAWAMCALFLVAIMSAAWVNRTSGSRQLSNEQVAGLFGSFAPAMERSTVQNQAPQDVVKQCVPDAPVVVIPGNFRLEAAERTTGNGHDAARLLLQDEGGRLALVIIKDATGVEAIETPAGTEFQTGTLNGTPCVMWQSNGSTILLMGPRSQEELLRIAQTMK